MTVARLLAALPGLEDSRMQRPNAIDWGRIERILGIEFPVDYKEIAEWYPPFEICEFISIGVPRAGREESFLDGVASMLEDLQDSFDAGFTSYHPSREGNGLIPWGASSSGDSYFWKMEEGCAVSVVTASGSDFFWEYEGTVTDFLADWLVGALTPLDQPTIHQLGGARISLF